MPDGSGGGFPSPFLAIPPSEWIAGNRSGYAVWDRFPVSRGHALVISHRVIPTWWEATSDERADLLALVDDVKMRIDAAHAADGYNVGFNAGAAAGQTVHHLHIHLIPRYDGDVPDPRGGVRHVIPGRPVAGSASTATGSPRSSPLTRRWATRSTWRPRSSNTAWPGTWSAKRRPPPAPGSARSATPAASRWSSSTASAIPSFPRAKRSSSPRATPTSATFAKVALNVATRPGEPGNALHALLRGWFGPSAGTPAPATRSRSSRSPASWSCVRWPHRRRTPATRS